MCLHSYWKRYADSYILLKYHCLHISGLPQSVSVIIMYIIYTDDNQNNTTQQM